jgi:hypothetical protein
LVLDAVPDSMPERVLLSDWSAVVEHVRRFGESGSVEIADDRAVAEFGTAHLTVERDGRVESGMPLHAFDADGVEALAFDHDDGAVRVTAGDVRYEFRRPG